MDWNKCEPGLYPGVSANFYTWWLVLRGELFHLDGGLIGYLRVPRELTRDSTIDVFVGESSPYSVPAQKFPLPAKLRQKLFLGQEITAEEIERCLTKKHLDAVVQAHRNSVSRLLLAAATGPSAYV